MKQYDEANACLEESLKIRQKISIDQNMIANTYLALGNAYKEQDDRETDALDAYKNCLRIRLRHFSDNIDKVKQAKDALSSFLRVNMGNAIEADRVMGLEDPDGV